MAASGDVSPLLSTSLGCGEEVGAVDGDSLADVAGRGVGVVGVFEVVLRASDGAAVVGADREFPGVGVGVGDGRAGSIPDIEFGPVVVFAADESVAFCPFAAVRGEAFGSE